MEKDFQGRENLETCTWVHANSEKCQLSNHKYITVTHIWYDTFKKLC